MGYLRCEACGAKALSAASTCPKCASPFQLHDARGERVVLKKCSGCGIMHRRDRACHWCGEQKTAGWRSPAALKSATGIAAVALVAVGSWSVREPARDAWTKALAAANAAANMPANVAAHSALPMSSNASLMSAAPQQTPTPALVNQDTIMVAMAEGVSEGSLVGPAPADSVQWVPAVARTWVNVHSDASRGGDVVGVIKPSEKAMLGIGRSGWRQVKSPDISGWVDPRLFEADSLRTRG